MARPTTKDIADKSTPLPASHAGMQEMFGPEPETTTAVAEPTTETTVTEPQKAQQTVATSQPEDAGFDAELHLRAKALGFNDTEIEGYGDDVGLQNAMTAFDRRLIRQVEASQAAAQPAQQVPQTQNAYQQFQQPQAPAPAPAQQPQYQQQYEAKPLQFKAEVKLNKEEYNEDVVNAINQVNDHFAGQVENLSNVVGNLAQSAMVSDKALKRVRMERFDDARGLMEGYDDILGQGSIFAMDPKSEVFQNNDKVYRKMGALEKGYNDNNLPVPAYRSLLKSALSAEFSDDADMRVRRTLAGKMDTRMDQMSVRSTRREGKSLSGRERSVVHAINEFEKHNVPFSQTTGGDPLEGLD